MVTFRPSPTAAVRTSLTDKTGWAVFADGGGPASAGSLAELQGNSLDAEFCDDMLRKTSRSFATVIQQLPPDLRPGVCVFYLLLRALDTVEDDMTVPLDGKVALLRSFHVQMQDENWSVRGYGFEEEQTLLEELPKLLRVFKLLPSAQQDVITDITKRMGEGMAEFAYFSLNGRGFATFSPKTGAF